MKRGFLVFDAVNWREFFITRGKINSRFSASIFNVCIHSLCEFCASIHGERFQFFGSVEITIRLNVTKEYVVLHSCTLKGVWYCAKMRVAVVNENGEKFRMAFSGRLFYVLSIVGEKREAKNRHMGRYVQSSKWFHNLEQDALMESLYELLERT